MKLKKSLLVLTLLQSFCWPVIAEEAIASETKNNQRALLPLASLDDFSQGQDGWSFGLGAGIEFETAYEGSDEFGLEVEPAGGLQWRQGNDVYFFVGEAIGWRGLRNDVWLFEAALGFDEGRKESDSDKGYLKGLGDVEEGFAAVLQTRRALDADWRYWLVGRIVAGDSGNLGMVGVGRRFGDQLDGTGGELNLVAVFHDSEFANRDFGITAEQATNSGYAQTTLSGGFRSFGLNYNYRHQLNDRWQIFGEALYELFSSEVKTSPIIRSNYEAEIGVGFIYLF